MAELSVRISGMGEYRANVAALMVNAEGLLLVCERLDHPGAWQFPQGGVDAQEEWESAVQREIEEEIGLKPEHYEIEKSKGGYCYDYPAGVKKGRFLGQEQTYYFCRVFPGSPELNLIQEPREFARARWIQPAEFQLNWLPDFKKDTYREVMRDFFGVEITR